VEAAVVPEANQETIDVKNMMFMFGAPKANNHGQDWYDNINATLSMVGRPVPY
jgi:hypothetical protein